MTHTRTTTEANSIQPTTRRQLFHVLGAAGVAVTVGGLTGRLASARPAPGPAPAPTELPFALPPLPYAFHALEPHIDVETMRIHHGKHHQAYVNGLNAAIEKNPALRGRSLEALLGDLAAVPEVARTAIRNHGGGHFNHSLFWTCMTPGGGGDPAGPLAAAIAGQFGSVATLREAVSKASTGQFGSGWGWLSVDSSGRLVIEAAANQDSPLSAGRTPLLGIDVWEHAYYLKYQSRRAEYVEAFWRVVNWTAVAERFARATAGS